jgi:hypothetical protein
MTAKTAIPKSTINPNMINASVLLIRDFVFLVFGNFILRTLSEAKKDEGSPVAPSVSGYRRVLRGCTGDASGFCSLR